MKYVVQNVQPMQTDNIFTDYQYIQFHRHFTSTAYRWSLGQIWLARIVQNTCQPNFGPIWYHSI